MSVLDNAIKNYLKNEKTINNAEDVARELNNQYEKTLRENGHNGFYGVNEAEKVLEAFIAWKQQTEKIKKAHETLVENEIIIRKYLEPLKGHTIVYQPADTYENGYQQKAKQINFCLGQNNTLDHI